MSLFPTRIAARMTLGVLVLLLFTALAIFAVMTLGGKPRLVATGTAAAEQSVAALARQLTVQLSRIEGTTAAMAHLAEKMPGDEALAMSLLPNLVDSQGDEAIAGGGLWPEPGAFSAGVERRSFFWARSDRGLEYSDDYNAPQTPAYHGESWYSGARSATPGRCVWSDGYLDSVSGVAMTTCSVPYKRGGAFAGVATIDLKLDGLASFLDNNGGVTGGYAFALDQAGNLLFFPGTRVSGSLATLSDRAREQPWLKPVADAVATRGAADLTLYLEHDGLVDGPAYVTLETMEGTGWRVGLVTPEARVTGLADELTSQMLLLLLPLLAVLLGVAWLAGKRLLAQLDETTGQIERLGQGGGRDDAQLEVRRADELGALRGAVNRYAGSLREMLRRIADESASLERQANELAGLAVGLADRAKAQRQDNTLLATAITEMSASAAEVAHNTTDCSDTARHSLSAAEQGQSQVQRNSEVIGGLAGDINQAAGAITQLGEDIERVGGVLDVIKSISEQTNLLALNAAIEAARAGEQGRGFAVVADEVRTLAGRTQSSANEIQQMITQLRQASAQAVATMQAGARRTHEAVQQADGVAGTLGSTVASFDDIVQRAQQIAVAAQQQSHVTQDINELAVRIHTASEEGARDAATLRELGQGMQAISQRLAGMSR